MKAEERRALVLRAAVIEFGRCGYEATSTVTIAERVGVSQPYIFRLFKTKKNLFGETAEWSLAELRRHLRQAGSHDGRGLVSTAELAKNFAQPSDDRRDLMRFELALCAAAGDPEFAKVARRHFDALWSEAARVTRAAEDELHNFFAGLSMLIVRSLLDE